MNIQALLHHELMLVAKSIVAKRYNEPTFSVKEELALARADRDRREKDLDQWPHSKINPFLNRVTKRREFHRDLSASSAKEQALYMYTSVATLMEYNDLLVTVDNQCAQIFEEWKFRGKSSSFKVKRFFKFYSPLTKAAHKDEKKDCARYAYLRMIDELDQELTFGTSWRPDASYVNKQGQIVNKLGRKISQRSKVNAYIEDQKDRALNPSYDVRDGVVVSSYALLMGDD